MIVVVFIAWIVILFTGRYPRGMFDFVQGVIRWGARVVAYAFVLVTDSTRRSRLPRKPQERSRGRCHRARHPGPQGSRASLADPRWTSRSATYSSTWTTKAATIKAIAGLPRPEGPRSGHGPCRQCQLGRHKMTRFRPGDEVFGHKVIANLWRHGGAFVKYAAAPASRFEPKPAGLTFEQAAAVPTSGSLAMQGVRDEGRVQAGQKVLINGAGWAVGTFAVQLAEAHEADVTGVDAAREARHASVDRRGPGPRLRAGGLHAEQRALRRHPRRRGEPPVPSHQARDAKAPNRSELNHDGVACTRRVHAAT